VTGHSRLWGVCCTGVPWYEVGLQDCSCLQRCVEAPDHNFRDFAPGQFRWKQSLKGIVSR
jgi:hypothetical protein